MKSKIMFYAFLVLIVFCAAVTYYKYVVMQDFDVTTSVESLE